MKDDPRLNTIKTLLKKYHPDHCQDAALVGLYTEMSRKLLALKNELEATRRDDQYYKLGMESLKLVHPERLYSSSPDGAQRRLDKATQEVALSDILKAIDESSFYFGQVVETNPASVWASDAKDKLVLLGKLKERYSKFQVSDEGSVLDLKQFLAQHGLRMV